ncbi:MAG: OadG family protein [Pseudomonadota bacterium]|jgi:oxaloacetate decarboxylase gamma subunit|nr:OadG family protein [Pseudomonadota bacterium]MED5510655.1 OadG family protein [Pseudomonadota bacterium]
MNASNLMSEGLNLMLVGMGFVFIFLTLLVFATSLMSKIITRYEKDVGTLPEEGIPAPTAVISQAMSKSQHANDDKNLITVLSAAVHKFRSRHK